jgi:ABC-2 type transport system ATP-binding protein
MIARTSSSPPSACVSTWFDEMSLATKKKVMLCACWIGAPKALLLDEASNGLDLEREYLVQRLQQAAREKTILFSAHDADFVSDSGAVAIEMTSLVGSAHLTGAMAAN